MMHLPLNSNSTHYSYSPCTHSVEKSRTYPLSHPFTIVFTLNLQFIMVFGSTVLNRPIVADIVEKHFEKALDLLDLELARELVSINPLFFNIKITPT